LEGIVIKKLAGSIAARDYYQNPAKHEDQPLGLVFIFKL
jgi:hypothetical protein